MNEPPMKDKIEFNDVLLVMMRFSRFLGWNWSGKKRRFI